MRGATYPSFWKSPYFIAGLFTPSHMSYEVDRQRQNPIQEPSLVEMVEKAIGILQKGEEGFILFVEGSVDIM